MKAYSMLGMAMVFGLAAFCGCAEGVPTWIPNNDPNLRKSSTRFAADAVKRHPYKVDAPRGGEAVGRAEVGYGLDRLDVVNLSNETWTDVEIWVNQNWVVFLPKMEPMKLKQINFEMIYDDSGRHFPLDNRKVMVNEVTILRDGKLYTVPCQLTD